MVLLASLGGYELSMVRKEIKNNLSQQLHAILSANVESLRIWIKNQKRDAEAIASQPGKGSTFILTLPKVQSAVSGAIKETALVSG